MADYTFKGQRTGGTAVTVATVSAPAASMRRVKIYDLIFGAEGIVADNPFLWVIDRHTAPGTASAVTPNPTTPSDAVAVTVIGENHTVEPTYTSGARLLTIPLNQRATFRWVAVKEGSQLIIPATANNGIGIRTPTAAAIAITVSGLFEE